MKRWSELSAIACCVFTLGALPNKANANERGSLRVDGRHRTYELHVPPGLDAHSAIPLVLALHGRLGNGHGMAALTHFDAVADAHHFFVVYPDGLHRGWADGRGATDSDKEGVDDVKFLTDLIRELSNQYAIDPARIYVTGISNGGFMAQRMACDKPDMFGAAVSVAATMGENTAKACHPEFPISIMMIQGTKDPLVPIGGGALGRNGSRGKILSVEATAQKWVALDKCGVAGNATTLPEKTDDGTLIRRVVYSGCTAGAEIVVYTIDGGGHTWPGGKQYLPAMVIGKTSRNMDASEAIWEFFEKHVADVVE